MSTDFDPPEVMTFNPDLVTIVPGVRAPTVEARHGTSLLYPAPRYDRADLEDVMTVESGQLATYQVQLGMSAKTVRQPICVNDIDDLSLVPVISCYTVTQSNGAHIDPKDWRAHGGKVEVEINPDTVTATVRIYGMVSPGRGPFSLSRVIGPVDLPTLTLVGIGVALLKRGIEVRTGLSLDDVSSDSTPEYDNPFLQTREQAYDAAHKALVRKLGGFQRVTLTVSGVKLDGADIQHPETAIGRVAGARLFWDGLFWRVRSATITPGGVSLTCEQDTTFGDFDDAMDPELTFGGFDDIWSEDGVKFPDFDYEPLRGGIHG